MTGTTNEQKYQDTPHAVSSKLEPAAPLPDEDDFVKKTNHLFVWELHEHLRSSGSDQKFFPSIDLNKKASDDQATTPDADSSQMILDNKNISADIIVYSETPEVDDPGKTTSWIYTNFPDPETPLHEQPKPSDNAIIARYLRMILQRLFFDILESEGAIWQAPTGIKLKNILLKKNIDNSATIEIAVVPTKAPDQKPELLSFKIGVNERTRQPKLSFSGSTSAITDELAKMYFMPEPSEDSKEMDRWEILYDHPVVACFEEVLRVLRRSFQVDQKSIQEIRNKFLDRTLIIARNRNLCSDTEANLLLQHLTRENPSSVILSEALNAIQNLDSQPPELLALLLDKIKNLIATFEITDQNQQFIKSLKIWRSILSRGSWVLSEKRIKSYTKMAHLQQQVDSRLLTAEGDDKTFQKLNEYIFKKLATWQNPIGAVQLSPARVAAEEKALQAPPEEKLTQTIEDYCDLTFIVNNLNSPNIFLDFSPERIRYLVLTYPKLVEKISPPSKLLLSYFESKGRPGIDDSFVAELQAYAKIHFSLIHQDNPAESESSSEAFKFWSDILTRNVKDLKDEIVNKYWDCKDTQDCQQFLIGKLEKWKRPDAKLQAIAAVPVAPALAIPPAASAVTLIQDYCDLTQIENNRSEKNIFQGIAPNRIPRLLETYPILSELRQSIEELQSQPRPTSSTTFKIIERIQRRDFIPLLLENLATRQIAAETKSQEVTNIDVAGTRFQSTGEKGPFDIADLSMPDLAKFGMLIEHSPGQQLAKSHQLLEKRYNELTTSEKVSYLAELQKLEQENSPQEAKLKPITIRDHQQPPTRELTKTEQKMLDLLNNDSDRWGWFNRWFSDFEYSDLQTIAENFPQLRNKQRNPTLERCFQNLIGIDHAIAFSLLPFLEEYATAKTGRWWSQVDAYRFTDQQLIGALDIAIKQDPPNDLSNSLIRNLLTESRVKELSDASSLPILFQRAAAQPPNPTLIACLRQITAFDADPEEDARKRVMLLESYKNNFDIVTLLLSTPAFTGGFNAYDNPKLLVQFYETNADHLLALREPNYSYLFEAIKTAVFNAAEEKFSQASTVPTLAGAHLNTRPTTQYLAALQLILKNDQAIDYLEDSKMDPRALFAELFPIITQRLNHEPWRAVWEEISPVITRAFGEGGVIRGQATPSFFSSFYSMISLLLEKINADLNKQLDEKPGAQIGIQFPQNFFGQINHFIQHASLINDTNLYIIAWKLLTSTLRISPGLSNIIQPTLNIIENRLPSIQALTKPSDQQPAPAVREYKLTDRGGPGLFQLPTAAKTLKEAEFPAPAATGMEREHKAQALFPHGRQTG